MGLVCFGVVRCRVGMVTRGVIMVTVGKGIAGSGTGIGVEW
ncbi:hypothetical protein JT321_gp46 [Providencia phage Kokobel1]|uniref:Uncharacterized protein n=1 Tax=Providencia phage Kokobel1 TaxID=2783540 RepID=A0A873WG96_9CAUD|nr:hypothetical protein JT321_gp46 [Providencia phage Kokobel1]QPB11473.1 hypothetical protein [Providencia phage Kokobel1]